MNDVTNGYENEFERNGLLFSLNNDMNEYMHCSIFGDKGNNQTTPTIEGTPLNQVEQFE